MYKAFDNFKTYIWLQWKNEKELVNIGWLYIR